MINLEKEIREQPEVLKNVGAANLETTKQIVAAAKAAGVTSIYFAARGTSDHACMCAQYLFGIVAGLPCTLATPSIFTKYGASVSLKNQLVIGVSQSGKAADVLTVMENAKAQGSITVAITNNVDSPMAKAADYHLFCNAGPEFSIAATKTFTSQLYLLYQLCGVWAGNEQFLAGLDKVSSAVAEVIDKRFAEIEKIAETYKDMTGAVVLARGIMYPIALEGALKMLETNRLKMKGYPISDFHHGPMAQLYPGDIAIVLAPKGNVFDDAKEMLEKLDKIGAEVIVLTDDEELAKSRKTSILMPDIGEYYAPFAFVVTMQALALKLTVVRGINPDKSDVLNKVTITK